MKKGAGLFPRETDRIAVALLLAFSAWIARGQDCNNNGTPDADDLGSRLAAAIRGVLPAPDAPLAVLAADLNSDGNYDLIISRWHGISIYLHDGAGGFTNSQNPAALLPYGFPAVLSDIDSDEDVDVLMFCHDYVNMQLNLFRNNGAGVFANAESMPLDVYRAGELTVGDLDGDGDDDILVSVPGGLRLFRNNGHGSFSVGEETALPDALAQVALADLDADGDQDVVASDLHTRTVRLLANNGQAIFAPIGELAYGPGGRWAPFAIGNFDGDGLPDLAVLVDEARFLRNDGHGAFSEWVDARLNLWGCFGDTNHDGLTDLVVEQSNAPILENVGNATFQRGPSSPHPISGEATIFDRIPAGSLPILAIIRDQNKIVLADVERRAPVSNDCDQNAVPDECQPDADDDGTPDVCDPAPHDPNTPKNQDPPPLPLDCNGDSIPDSGGTSSQLILGLSHSLILPIRLQEYNPIILFADLNGDGAADMIAHRTAVRGAPGPPLLFLNDGVGGFTAPVELPQTVGARCISLDFNGDETLDLYCGAAEANFGAGLVLLNAGDATFSSSIAVPGKITSIRAVDLNGDQNVDLVGLAATDYPTGTTVASFRNRDRVSLDASVLTPAGLMSLVLQAADFDGNAAVDLALIDSTQRSIVVLYNDGRGRFPIRRTVALDDVPSEPQIADFNCDGAPDIIVYVGGETRSRLLLNDGEGAFTISKQFVPFGTVVDLDRDGHPDIISSVGDQILAYTNQGNGAFSAASSVQVSNDNRRLSWKTVDLDADGRLEIVVPRGSSMDVLKWVRVPGPGVDSNDNENGFSNDSGPDADGGTNNSDGVIDDAEPATQLACGSGLCGMGIMPAVAFVAIFRLLGRSSR